MSQAQLMQLNLHANATTTPKVRAAIQESPLSDRKLAAELGVSVSTVRRWRQRTTVADLPHTPHRLRTTESGPRTIGGRIAPALGITLG